MRVRHWFLIGLLLSFELLLVVAMSFRASNLAKISYRREERSAALEALHRNPSPENKAALQEEWRLAGKHVTQQQSKKAGVLLAVFLAADGVAFYLWKQSAGGIGDSRPPTEDIVL